MKKVLVCVGMMLLMAASAMAAGQVQTPGCGNCGGTPTYQNYGIWQNGQGGEFTLIVVGAGPGIDLASYSNSAKNQGVYSNGSSVSPSFQTFCIEENEFIYANTLSNYSISQYAQAGGNGGQVGSLGDPISVGTAWLYSRFARGTLDYNYANTTGGRYSDAGALQEAFWFLENEIGPLATNGAGTHYLNKYVDEVLTQLNPGGGTLAAQLGTAQGDANGQYGVAALNLYDNSGNKQQTQLVLTVPDTASTFGLLGLGLAGLGLVSRRFRQTA